MHSKIIEQTLLETVLRHVENKEVSGDSQHGFNKGQTTIDKFGGILRWSYNVGGSGKNKCHLPGLVSLCWWHPQNWKLHHDLSVLEAFSFPLSSCEMRRQNLIKFRQTGQTVTETQSKVSCGISKSSTIHFSVHHSQGASGDGEVKLGEGNN